jgi:hypothetical protein
MRGFYGSFGSLPRRARRLHRRQTRRQTRTGARISLSRNGREVRGQRTCLDRCKGMGLYVREYGPRTASCTCLDSLDGNPISICYLHDKGHQIPKIIPPTEENTDLPGVIEMTSAVVGFAFLAAFVRWQTRRKLGRFRFRGGEVARDSRESPPDGHYQPMAGAMTDAQTGPQAQSRFSFHNRM